ncbi:MAG: DUF1573 domain-containing protein [Cytophagales bacterium]|nr:DUF1573 domain-containing protein [Cytophagales bacterium]
MKKAIFLFISVVFGAGFSSAQKLPAIFERYEYDFGYIYEENGAVSYDFIFKSNSNSKMVVSRAKASCGCTSPDWSKDSISSGGRGFVRVSYNPLNRPGPFRKSVKVNFSGDTITQEIFIKGVVILKPKNSSNILAERIGSLKLKSRYLHLGNIKNNQSTVKEFELLNEGEKPIKLISLESPKWIRASDLPAEIPPKEKYSLRVSYDPRPKNDLGYSEDMVELVTNDDSISSKQLVVSAIIEEYFPPMSEEELKICPQDFLP